MPGRESSRSMRLGHRRAALFLSLALGSALGMTAISSGPALAQGAHRSAHGSSALIGASSKSIDVSPRVTALPGRGRQTTYVLPYGETITDRTPPAGFDPLTARPSQLREYNFPPRPSRGPALTNWKHAMAAFKSDMPPVGPVRVDIGPDVVTQDLAGSRDQSTYAANWAGFFSGQASSESHAFVAVQADTTVPSADGCGPDHESLSAWIGLGGTDSSNADQLVQQGEICGNTAVSSGGGFRPFEEFAVTKNPVGLCGYSSWVFSAGDVLYQQLSYETSSNVANFYIEDETTGVAHGCAVNAPISAGWSFDGNTADYEVETSDGVTVSFSKISFTDAMLEWSTGEWVGFGTRPTTKTYDGISLSDYCAGPSTIGSDEESFSVSYSSGVCG